MAYFGKESENLKKRGYAVKEFATAKEAADYLNGEIDGVSVGFGGSATLDVMGLYDMLSSHNTVYWHWKQDKDMARKAAMQTDVYLTSANALAETGEIINIDGVAIVWHPRCLGIKKFIMSLVKISWNQTLKRLLPVPEILRHLRERHSLEKRHPAL